jgi:transcriptional regulator with XRE-family HTH domain
VNPSLLDQDRDAASPPSPDRQRAGLRSIPRTDGDHPKACPGQLRLWQAARRANEVARASAIGNAALRPLPGSASVGDQLRIARERRRLSQRILAYRLARDHCMVSRWESNQREPTLFDLTGIARVLKTTVMDLLAGVDAPISARGCSSRAYGATRRAELGHRWEDARRRRGMTVWDLYRATGIPGRRLRRIEEGVDVGVGEAIALAAALDLDLDRLISPVP